MEPSRFYHVMEDSEFGNELGRRFLRIRLNERNGDISTLSNAKRRLDWHSYAIPAHFSHNSSGVVLWMGIPAAEISGSVLSSFFVG